MKPYQNYSPSGTKWIGEIPETWIVKKLKYISCVNKKTLPENTLPSYEFRYVDIGSVNLQDGISEYTNIIFEDAPSRARRIVEKGDTIVSTVRTYLKAIAKIEDDNDVIVSTGFAVLKPLKIDSDFFSYVLRAPYFVETISANSVGVSYPAINATEIMQIKIAFPIDIYVQRQIANYLDNEIGRLNKIIKAKGLLISQLKEKREALIEYAVTKGLDANVRMKPSGVEWIGQIPEEWDVKKLKYIFSIYNGATPKSDNFDFWNGDINWITPADFTTDDKYITQSNRKITEEGLNSCATKIVPSGSIIISNRAPIGTVGIATIPVTTNQGCKSLVKNKNVDERFYYYFLAIQNKMLNALGKGTTFLELSNSDLASFHVPFPDFTTQVTISDYLDIETEKITSAIGKTMISIDKLKEYRTTLISNCVTGKIDVGSV